MAFSQTAHVTPVRSTTPLVVRLERLADLIHARNDQFAREMGWTVTRTGLTGRTYRDPRLDQAGGAR